MFPFHFYYQEFQGSVDYTKTITGQFDINQLLHQEPYWVLNDTKTISKKKKIIFKRLANVYLEK